jgi:hypothetical protein
MGLFSSAAAGSGRALQVLGCLLGCLHCWSVGASASATTCSRAALHQNMQPCFSELPSLQLVDACVAMITPSMPAQQI